MIYTEKSCKKFIEAAASKEPVPGGGSVAALAGALGTSLGHMVGALTVGKKKYADVEDEMMELMKEGRQLQRRQNHRRSGLCRQQRRYGLLDL